MVQYSCYTSEIHTSHLVQSSIGSIIFAGFAKSQCWIGTLIHSKAQRISSIAFSFSKYIKTSQFILSTTSFLRKIHTEEKLLSTFATENSKNIVSIRPFSRKQTLSNLGKEHDLLQDSKGTLGEVVALKNSLPSSLF